MITIPETLRFRLLLVLNIIFAFTGLSMIGYGIFKAAADEPEIAKELDSFAHGAAITILIGVTDLVLGTVGLVGLWFKKRIYLMVYSGVLAFVVISSLIYMILFIMGTAAATKDNAEMYQKAILERYGYNGDVNSKEITVTIDHHQNKEQCCGWSLNLEENIFLKTPWFRDINLNVSLDRIRYVPDSCCLKAGPACRSEPKIKDGRDKKVIYPKDCMETYISGITGPLWFSITLLIITMLMQITAITVTVLHLLSPDSAAE